MLRVTVASGDIAATAVGAFILAVLYLAPTMVAAGIRSKNLLAVVLVDVLLAWTVVGWVVAWILCFSGRRTTDAQPALHWPAQSASLPGAYGLSPDGMFWWDGIAWRDTRVVAPPHAPRSPDGFWWWDSRGWRPVPPPPPPPH